MLGELLGGFVDKEEITKETIKAALENIAQELNVPFSEILVTIKPIDKEFEFRLDIYKMVGKSPVHVREISVAEIVGKK